MGGLCPVEDRARSSPFPGTRREPDGGDQVIKPETSTEIEGLSRQRPSRSLGIHREQRDVSGDRPAASPGEAVLSWSGGRLK